MHELLKLVAFSKRKSDESKRLALATIIDTIGSSYRKTGTQMIIAEDLTYEGALSGGCVEKEVLRQSLHVFNDGRNVVFEYDGRYKLGCNGRIFVLIEPLAHDVASELASLIEDYHNSRLTFSLEIRLDEAMSSAETAYTFPRHGKYIPISRSSQSSGKTIKNIELLPQHQLVILGGEYDSAVLANMTQLAGMRTYLVVGQGFSQPIFPGVHVSYVKPGALSNTIQFDKRTAIVLMTHSLSRDLGYLTELVSLPFAYLGVLGPIDRRNTLLNDLMTHHEELFLNNQEAIARIKGPVGLPIGGRTPEEIAVSILAEVIQTFQNKANPSINTRTLYSHQE